MRNIYSGPTGLDTPITPKLCQVKPWNWVHILAAAALLLASFWITDPQLGHAQNSVPVKPAGLTAAAGNNQAALTWTDPSDNSITGYEYLQAQVDKLTASDGAARDDFGLSVAVDGDTVVVGASGYGDNGASSGSAYVYVRQSAAWSQVAKLTASDGAARDDFGLSVAVDGDTVVVGAIGDDDNGSNSGSAYVFTKPAAGWTTTSSFTAKLTASDGAAGDYFGVSVAVYGDTVVVGAGWDDDQGEDSGSAYVFTKPAAGWTTTSSFAAKLTASDGAAGDKFGRSVAVNGNTVVVGARGDSDNGWDAGSAYVFTKPVAGWTTTSNFAAKLTASDGEAHDYFGNSVAVDGDTVAVGATYDDDNGSKSGSAYVFTKPAAGWTTTSSFTAKLTASDGAASDYFGQSVAVDGDTVAVGAHGDDNNIAATGSAYVFTKPAAGWTTTSTAAKLIASDGAAIDYFGQSVAVDGDTVLVGAPGYGDEGTNSGSAYIYELSDWTAVPNSAAAETNATSYTVTSLANDVEYRFQIRATNDVGTGPASNPATVTPTNTAPTAVNDTSSTAEDTAIDIAVLSNDTDADGDTLSVTQVTSPTNGTAVILQGNTTSVTYTPNDDFNGTDSFDYTVSDGTDTDTGTVNVTITSVNDPPVAVEDNVTTPEDAAIDINVVSNDTDVDGDALSVTQVTTASNGVATIMAGSTTTVTYTPNTDFVGTDSFTYTVSDGTDTDTGTATINIGDPPVKPAGLTATAGNNQAALTWTDPSDNSITGYEYHLRAQTAKLTASDGAPDDEFGNSVAVDGDTMVVGTRVYDGNGSDPGSAYVYVRQSGVWSRVAKLTASDGAGDDRFGYSVAVDGDTVVVGAYRDDDNGSDSGSAYVFTKPAAGWTTTSIAAKLTASDGAPFDYFGHMVRVDGETVVVGAYMDDDNGSESGSAYVFTKPGTGWTTTSSFAAKLTTSDGAPFNHFGFSVAVDGDTVVVGARFAESAYVFTKPGTGWTTTSSFSAKLTASDGAAHDRFGYKVTVNGDTLLVSAYRDNDKGTNSGSAYVFTKPGTGWTTTSNFSAKLTASDGAANDWFGYSVGIDGETLVVGARYDDDNGSESGSAYVFTKPGTGWTTTSTAAKLTASDGAASDWFGYSVAVDGDTVVVGAIGDDDNGSESGSAYVYAVPAWTTVPNSAAAETNATSYTVTSLANDVEYRFQIRATNDVGASPASDPATVTPTNTAPTAVDDTSSTDEDTAVDINVVSNDTDADGDTLSVTAVTTPSNGTAAITSGSATTVTYTPNANFAGTDAFDYTVTDGTGTDTGTVTVTVTAVNDPPVAVDDSASTPEDTAIDINVVSNDTDVDADTLSVTQVTTPSNGTAAIVTGSTTTVTYTPNANFVGTDSFTYTVSDGTGTDTGTANIIIGDPPIKPTGLTAAAGNSQAALTWDNPSDNNITGYEYLKAQVAKLTASDGSADARFGTSVAVDGDTMVIGIGYDDTEPGSAYVFIRQSGAWSQAAKLTASDGADQDWFGYSVAVEGKSVVVGSPYDDDNGSNSGSAYVFTKPGTGWTTTSNFSAKLTAYDGAVDDLFGFSVAVDGDTIVVGAYRDDDNGTNSGSAYVFTKLTDGWVTTSTAAKLTASDAATNDQFGHSVAVDGDTIVVGAHGDDNNNMSTTGSAYVFTKPTDGWVTTSTAAKLTASDAAANDEFAYSVAVDGDTIVVGAHGDDNNIAATGSAYVFSKPTDGWVTTSTAAKLTAPDAAARDNLGFSVAVERNTVVVGSHLVHDNNNMSTIGSAYVFTKPTDGWVTTSTAAKLTASDAAADAHFAYSLALNANTLVIGIPRNDDNGTNSGSAYAFQLSDWTTVPNSAHNTDPVGANATSYTITGLTNGQEYNFWVQAINALGTSNPSDLVTVTPINTAPSAEDDTASTPEDTAVDINVISNDTDADADTLSVTALTTPSNGTAEITSGSTTTVTYTPVAGFNGTDSFDYTVSDGTGTDTGTVNVTVEATEVIVGDLVNLSALTVTSGTGNEPLALNEEFAEDTTAYTLNVPNSVASVRVTPTKKYDTAANVMVKIKVNATEVDGDSLMPVAAGGVTTIEIDVIATISPPAGVAAQVSQTYAIWVSRPSGSTSPTSSNADLAALTVSGGALDTDFDSGITDYTMTVANSVASISLDLVTAHSRATVVVRADSMEVPADNIHLTEGGITIIAVVVTAQDRTTTRTYTIQVFRAASVPVVGGGSVNRNPTPSFVEGSQTIRWVTENTPGGANIGEPILATDATGDRLSYALLGTDTALFDIDSTSAQLLTNGPLDFESKSSHRVSVGVSNSRGGRDIITVTINLTNIDEPGTVAVLPAQPAVGRAMTAVLTDPDARITGITWQWAVSSGQIVWLDIPGATSDSYMPIADDAGQYLRVTATYTDGAGSGHSAQTAWDTPLASPAAPEPTVMPTPAAATPSPEPTKAASLATISTPAPTPVAATPGPEPAPTAAATSPAAVPSAAVVPTPAPAAGVPATSAFDPAADDSGIDLWVISLIAALAVAAAAGLIILGVRIIRA